jgi:UDP:flavonoid glycosyltransferase YjiC (YdhE family)
VVAGTTEEKMAVSARVTWAGVGVARRTDTPSAEQVSAAVADVLGLPAYRERARELQAHYARYPGAARGAGVVLEVARGRALTESAS